MFAVANWNDRENWLFDTMCVIDNTVYMRWIEREQNCMSGRRCTTFSTHLYCGCRNFSVQPNWSSNCQNAFSELNTVWRMERALRMTVQQHGETSKQHFIENIDLCVQTSIFTERLFSIFWNWEWFNEWRFETKLKQNVVIHGNI